MSDAQYVTATSTATADHPLVFRWRTLEWWGVAICLFLQSGAVFAILVMEPDGGVGDAGRSKLRLLSLPVYLIAGGLLAPHLKQLVVALRRNPAMTVFLLLPLLSILWSVGPSVSLRRAIGLLGSVALSYLIAIRFTPRQMLLLVALALGPSIVLSFLLIGVKPSLAFMPMEHELRGVFVHKNVLGRSAVLACLVAAVIATDRSLEMRKTGVLLLVMSMGALLLSQSVTSIFTGVVASALALVNIMLARRRGLGRVVLALLILQVAALLLVFLDQFLVPLLESLGKDATLTGRVPLWHLVDERIGRHLLFGFGYQAFWTDSSPDAWEIWSIIGWSAPNAHSGYRETLLGLGVVGFAVMAVLIAQTIWQGTSLHCDDPRGGWLWVNAFVGSFIAMNLTESLFILQNDMFWTLFMACSIACSLRYREMRSRKAGLSIPDASELADLTWSGEGPYPRGARDAAIARGASI